VPPQEFPTKAPGVFVYVTAVQLSVAIGDIACAAAKPVASLHATVTFNAPATVVQTGAVLSTILVVAGDSLQAATVLGVPAVVSPQSAASTYLVLIL